MIEYTDDKFGIIKVLNVTEARAHFATVLGDNHSHYVITKNNKPMRVIIGYSDYEKLKQQLGPEFIASIQEAGLSYPSQRQESAQADVDRKQQKAKSRVPGILESNIALSYGLPDKRQRTVPAKEVVPSTVSQAPLQTTAQQPPQQAAATPEQNAHDDYFSSAPIEFDETSDYLTSPDVAHDATIPFSTPPAAPRTTTISSEQSQDIHDALQQALEATAQAKKATTPAPTKRAVVEPSAVEGSETPVVEKKKDPEQDDYFRKYKKLYERFEAPQPQQTPEEIEPSSLAEEKPTFDDSDLEGELEAYPEAETKTADVIEEPNEYFGQAEQGDAPSQITRTNPQQQPAPSEAPRQNAGQGHVSISGSRQGGSPELPSLKDLLASLDEEKLSGEDEEVDEAEIENLIQRIQED